MYTVVYFETEVVKLGTRENILEIFENNKGTYFSGEELAESLGISRTAVWKAVKSLQNEGYRIDALTRKGYCLLPENDILSAQGIEKYLKTEGISLKVLSETESTNTLVREEAAAGAPEGLIIAANSQTKGRGRLGRSFYSPSDTGVYLSILLRPDRLPPSEAVKITTMAAVAACEAVEEVSGRESMIKWVNDIFVDGRKVTGILTEASFSMENNSIEYAVMGIGFNAYEPQGGFPEEIKNIAGAIFTERKNDGKNLLAAGFINRFMKYYREGTASGYVKKYKEKSLVIGRNIEVISQLGSRRAVATGIDDDCRLCVRYEDGSEETLGSGEISIRFEK